MDDRKYESLELDQFKVLSDWYHLALLDLIHTRGFKPRHEWIAKRLGITVKQAREASLRLRRLGLLEVREDGGWKKTKRMLLLPTDRSHASVRNFHQIMIQKAADALEENGPFEKRSITGTTFSINPKKIAEAKKKIARFEHQLLKFLTEGTCTEVYQFNVQLFQLTQPEEIE